MVLKLIVPHKKPLLIIKIKMYICLYGEISLFLNKNSQSGGSLVLVKTIIQSTNQAELYSKWSDEVSTHLFSTLSFKNNYYLQHFFIIWLA